MMNGIQRVKVTIRGAVQGVGFRPFVYNLANSLNLNGWVINSSQGVFIEAEGDGKQLGQFLLSLEQEKPSLAYIQSFESSYLDPIGFHGFEIKQSKESGKKTVLVLPDIATCPQCLREIFDPDNRRYLYPFTNCTLCGPRYTIINSLPYDRPNTSMKHFPMCEECQKEYEDPTNRRFHAQPNACPKCGPAITLNQSDGKELSSGRETIDLIVDSLKNGRIAAIKGVGGFHLMVDASNPDAINQLRLRKKRNEKPFAVMMPDLESVRSECDVNSVEERLLLSPEAPIVLLTRLKGINSTIDSAVAPGNPTLGIMLPYSPLHYILLHRFCAGLVATSGNLSDEPICIDNEDALNRLGGIADIFLLHNRPIVRHVDDSLVRVVADREMMLRRSRGYAPMPIQLVESKESALAVGAHQKNAVSFQIGRNAVISQHIGDLETEPAFEAFKESISSLQALYEAEPNKIICDLHPEYLSTKHAFELKLKVEQVQHHHAHVASCMAENELTGDVLGVAWDGTGAGPDGTIWGGEFLVGNPLKMSRISHFRSFKLPGGGQAIKEPRRTALGVLFEIFGEQLFEMSHLKPVSAFEANEGKVICQMLKKGFNSPVTSSAGRLFDAVSSIIGLKQIASFEGQGAMELEFLLNEKRCQESYSFHLNDFVDWEPMIQGIIMDLEAQIDLSSISAKFHNTMVEIIVAVAKKVKKEKVVLSGGCFQNRYLTERTIDRLRETGFKPYWHQRVPPNDGGIALGQLYARA